MGGNCLDGRSRIGDIQHFAGSWILLLSCLVRESVLTLSTDLNHLADEIRVSAPNYFLNVPTLLERVRRGVLGTSANAACWNGKRAGYRVTKALSRFASAMPRMPSCNSMSMAS